MKKILTVFLVSLFFSEVLFADKLPVYKIATPKGSVSNQNLSVLSNLAMRMIGQLTLKLNPIGKSFLEYFTSSR